MTNDELNTVWQLAGFFWIETGLGLEHHSFQEFVAMFAVTVNRVSMGRKLVMQADRFASLAATKEFAACLKLAERLRESTGTSLGHWDVAFLAAYLMEIGVVLDTEVKAQVDWEVLETCAEVFIDSVESRLGVELGSDHDFKSGLMSHFQRSFRLRKLGIDIHNPLLEEIKKQFPGVFTACLESVKVAGEAVGYTFGQDEAAYLAMHVAAALERKRERPKKVIVCATAQSAARLLSARLSANFKGLEIEAVVLVSQIGKHPALDKVDFVVSSVPLRVSKEVIVVSPLMTQDDLRVLETKGLSKVVNVAVSPADHVALVDRIVRAILQRVKVDNPRLLMKVVSDVLSYEGLTAPAGGYPPLQNDIERAAIRMARKFKEAYQGERCEKIGPTIGGVVELKERFGRGLERIMCGAKLTRHYLDGIVRCFPTAFLLVERLLSEFGAQVERKFTAEETAYLTACAVTPLDTSVVVTRISLMTSRTLGLDIDQMETLEQLLWCAYEGAQEEGITLNRRVLTDLALHLASTVLGQQDVTVLKEMACKARDELRPEMVRAGKAMARLMSKVLGRPVEAWEETYLAIYAGSSALGGSEHKSTTS